MAQRPDMVVCNPNASSNRGKAVFFYFEIVNPATLESTGKPHNIAMPHADAKRLLGILEAMSKQYGWLEMAPEVLRVPPDEAGSATSAVA